MKKHMSKLIFAVFILAYVICCIVRTPISEAVGSMWSLLPPIVAIGLALITKEVYSSLFIGIVTGGVVFAIASSSGFPGVFNTIVKDGIIANLADEDNMGILVFLVVLGIIVVLMNKAGGSRAYGEWAAKRIKTRKGASISTFALGVLIFVDDYFNCLTVGSVMRPVTDKHKVSRAKLAYLIDATAAPVCIIAPISSWAAAVSGTVKDVNGIQLFIRTIPFNLYALLTLIMVVFIALSDIDYGPMKLHEDNARKGDLFTSKSTVYPQDAQPEHTRGKVIDLVLPVIVLIVMCVLGMLYTGGLFDGADFIDAFADCNACYGLALGSIGALIIIVIYFLLRRVLTFTACMEAVPAGFKQMVPAILILTFAWTLKTITSNLEAGSFVSGIVESATAVEVLLPAILFVVALGLSFATGTSWGTFGILIPIVTEVFKGDLASVTSSSDIPVTVIICISACLAGAVCGDHCSPISDTTIMASTGAQCDHVNHVSTQLPYAMTVAGVCVAGYVLAGAVKNVYAVLGCSVVALLAILVLLRRSSKNRNVNAAKEAENSDS